MRSISTSLTAAGLTLTLLAGCNNASESLAPSEMVTSSGSGGPVISSCTLGYPFSSANPRTSVAFNESDVLAGVASKGGKDGAIMAYYSDEHALLLGVRKGANGVTAMTSDPGHAVDPDVGDPTQVDGYGRPFSPALFITDITSNPDSKDGDWQSGGSAISPGDVFGAWKGAGVGTASSGKKSKGGISVDSDPAKNSWNLGPDSDAPPAGAITGSHGFGGQGYSAEVRWNLKDLNLHRGSSYRLQFMVHDGDQNKTGGDVGQACVNVTVP